MSLLKMAVIVLSVEATGDLANHAGDEAEAVYAQGLARRWWQRAVLPSSFVTFCLSWSF